MTPRPKNRGESFVYVDAYLVRAGEYAVLVEFDGGSRSTLPMSVVEDPQALLHAKPREWLSIGVARSWARMKGWGVD